MDTKDCITTIYNERNRFIIVGLTGRTGSGCTESAQILASEKFVELKLKEPKSQDYKANDERKYKIIYDYAKENWNEFYILNMSDVIFSFILHYDLKEMCDILKIILCNLEVNIQEKFEGKHKFVSLYNKTNVALNKLLNEKKSLKRESNKELEEAYDLLGDIKKLQTEFKEIISQYQYRSDIEINGKPKQIISNAYTYLYQKIGNNIRSSGNINCEEFRNESMFHLARRANDFIKAIKNHNENEDKPTLICIDAIRNPYEAHYLRDRYSAFYLISINTEDEERKRRLCNLTKDQIESLDTIEYPKKLEGIKKFVNQNIAACIELSDIHIYNPRSSTIEKYYLSEQLVKYIMLMKHPGLVTPTHVERCMQIAYNAKLNSGCLSRQVGAVITDSNYSINAIGWNEVPEGQVPCNLRDICNLYQNKDYKTFSKYEIEDSEFNEVINEKSAKIKECNIGGRCFQYCFKDMYEEVTGEKNQVHTRALHAEENAFLQIVKYGGQGIMNGNLFTTASPCESCSKKAYQLGIRNIYYIDPYPGISIQHILSFENANGEKPHTHLFLGAIGRAYANVYSQKLSIKDELSLLTKI